MDPITMMLIAQGVAGLGKAGYGAWQKRQGKQALESAFEAPTGTPSEYADLIQQARASELTKRRLDEINRTMATSTAALQQSGSRGVIGGIGAVTAAGAGAKTQVLSQQQADILQAMTRATMGAENQRQRDMARQMREENLAMAAIQAGQENIIGGVGDVMQAGLQYGQARSEGLIGTDKTKTKIDNSMVESDSLALQAEIRNPYLESLKGQKPQIKIMKDGAKVKKTPGKFSHKSNPIDIMKDGAKIGEMTGGEYIFNPSQAKSMQKLAKSGNSDLHKFVRSLLNKPQFK
jgi:hypothetical protein